MADKDFKNDGLPEIARHEHDRKNVGTKKVDLWAYLPGSDEKVRITAVDNGDGTYSLKSSTGKAVGSPATSSDSGAPMLGKRQDNVTISTVDDGDYDVPSLTEHSQMRVHDQEHLDIQNCNDVSQFTVFNSDTSTLAQTNNHQFGTGAISFDKVDGASNSVYAGVTFTLNSVNIQDLFEDAGFVGLGAYLTSINNVVRVILRLGTDASNYNEWRWEVEDLVAARWNSLRAATGDSRSYAGSGWNTSNIDYGAVLVEFNSQSNTLSGIVIDNIHLVSGRVTDSNAAITINSSTSGSKVDVTKVGGNTIDTNTGNASAGTQRVVLATDQPAIDVNASVESATYTTRIDEASATVTYIGDAAIGSSTASALWRIKKIDTTSGTSITFADGNGNFDNIWDNRASLSYS